MRRQDNLIMRVDGDSSQVPYLTLFRLLLSRYSDEHFNLFIARLRTSRFEYNRRPFPELSQAGRGKNVSISKEYLHKSFFRVNILLQLRGRDKEDALQFEHRKINTKIFSDDSVNFI